MDNEESSPKWLIRISITLFVSYTIIHFITVENRLAALIFIVSGSFGFLLKFGGLGYACAFSELYRSSSLFGIRTLIIIIFFGTLFTGLSKSIFEFPLLYGDDAEFILNEESVGVQLIIGSFLFGMGMILATCCASGTLVTLGSGSFKSLFILIFFIIGFTLSCADFMFENYSKLPKTEKSITFNFLINMVILLVLFLLTFLINLILVKFCKKKTKDQDFILLSKKLKIELDKTLLEEDKNSEKTVKDLKIKYIFSMILGFLIGMFFLLNGTMIGISGAFGLFGATVCKFFGAEPDYWESFQPDGLTTYFLENKIFNNDMYIIFGAFIASSIKRNYASKEKLTIYDFVTSSLGGLLMGIGAKMAYGCNIGGMTSGICSNSLHGYVWLIGGLLGSACSVLILNIPCLKRTDRGPNGEPKKIILEEKLPIEQSQDNLLVRESKSDIME